MPKKKLLWLLAGIGSAAFLVALPIVHAAIVLLNLVAHCVVLGLQLVSARLPRFRPVRLPRLDEDAFVSIHVPAHNEPPELLKQTLQALGELKWRNYEVLVIDNNTTDETLWRPIEAFCEELGPRFRFLHVESLKGFKAGAMNWARPFMNPRAEYIFVVDADYVVNPNSIRRALGYFVDAQVGIVQFPQEYRNLGRGNVGLALDFKHFFAGYMNMANHLGCVPSTGTLTMISRHALQEIGGFDTECVTEDAELGFRMNARGYRSIYVNEVIGHGLMPHDLESLKKQRWRWAFGNAQILKLNWRRILLGPALNWRQKIGYLTHLTAWFNFNLIPSLSLVLLSPLALFECLTPLQHYIVVASGFTLATFMVLRFGTLFYSLRHEGYRLSEIWLAYLTHLGLGWIFSASWLKCLLDHRSPFVRTNKFISQHVPSVFRTTFAEASLGVAMLAACVVLALMDFVIAPVAAFLMCVCRALVYWVWLQTLRTLAITQQMAGQIAATVAATDAEALTAEPMVSLDENVVET